MYITAKKEEYGKPDCTAPITSIRACRRMLFGSSFIFLKFIIRDVNAKLLNVDVQVKFMTCHQYKTGCSVYGKAKSLVVVIRQRFYDQVLLLVIAIEAVQAKMWQTGITVISRNEFYLVHSMCGRSFYDATIPTKETLIYLNLRHLNALKRSQNKRFVL